MKCVRALLREAIAASPRGSPLSRLPRGLGRRRVGAVVLCALLLLVGCTGQQAREDVPSRGPALGERFTIGYGQEITLEGEELKVGFDRVASDSRCPSDPEVQCISEGFAQIVLRLSAGGEDPAFVRLSTPNSFRRKYPSAGRYLGYTVRLIKLSPYPEAGGRVKKAEYAATLLVTEERVGRTSSAESGGLSGGTRHTSALNPRSG